MESYSSYTGVCKIYAHCFQNINPMVSKYTPFPKRIITISTLSNRLRRHQRRRSDLTTGVTTRSLRGVEGERAGNDTTRSVTKVCWRRVESGLGGHEAGASGLTRGSRTHRSRYKNWDEWPCQIVRPSVVLKSSSKHKADVSSTQNIDVWQ